MPKFRINYIDPKTQERVEVGRVLKAWADYSAEEIAHQVAYELADKNLNYKIHMWVDAPMGATAKGYWVKV